MLSEELKDKLLNYKSRMEYNIIDFIPVLGYIIPKVEQLEKENEELKECLEGEEFATYLLSEGYKEFEKENELLKHQINEAEKQRDDYWYENNKLREQNEMMQNCGNCKHDFIQCF